MTKKTGKNICETRLESYKLITKGYAKDLWSMGAMTRMEKAFWEWAEENLTPWPHPKKLLTNYWIVWQAAWHKSNEKVEDDDGRC
jgi:hypothetical protein